MDPFFKGWRCKAGCVTLVMACVFMAGWVRSMHIEDYLWLSLAPVCSASSSSMNGSLHCSIKCQNLNIVTASWSANRWSRPVIESGRMAYANPGDAWWLDEDGYVVTKGGVKIGGKVDGQLCWMETPPPSNSKLPALNTDCIDLYGNITKSSRPPPDPDPEFRAVIPYWCVMIPLTLTSLWLLLSRPRQSTRNKTAEATANDGITSRQGREVAAES